MAAYAALVSLTHVINQLQHHPRPPFFLDKQQVESLTQNIAFLEGFLETHNGVDSEEVEALASRIAGAAYAAEDIIESHIVDQIVDGTTSGGRQISPVQLYEGLQKLNEYMDLIKKAAMELKPNQRSQEKMELMEKEAMELKQKEKAQEKMQRNTMDDAFTTMVGMDDALYEMMDMLVGRSLDRKVIPITGMGGIGKTTLARNLYRHQTVVEHFHFLAWATISREYTMKEIVLQLLGNDMSGQMNEYELAEKLHKELSGRRYLIIIDDIWDIKIWDQLKLYFPNFKNGSRIVITTRLSNLASLVSDLHGIEMGFLNEDQSWNLFCNIVFGREDSPRQLKKIGRQIVESCRGLPLSINVIGGHLAMSAKTQQHWESIAENVSSFVNLDSNEHCLKILYTSYNNLPLHLKPCFLYMGVFREDIEIHASHLIRLWVAEGFLKPYDGKILEDVGEECLTELVQRNLILVEKRNYYGKVKSVRIHDLLRDLCLRVDASQQPRIWTNERTKLGSESTKVWGSLSVARSSIWKHEQPQLSRSGARLLRLYERDNSTHQNSFLQHLQVVSQRVKWRYINIGRSDFRDDLSYQILSSISLLWNLQTLVLASRFSKNVIPFEIWKLPQLRHIKIHTLSIELPNHDDDFVLENLQTLLVVQNLNFREEMVKRIPNLKKLVLNYSYNKQLRSHDINLKDIRHLRKLNTLTIDNHVMDKMGLCSGMQTLILPHSLKKLTLSGTALPWELMTEMVGSLPLLEGLRLRRSACRGREWMTVEDQFRSLKLLEITRCRDLEYWETESSHFPRLEHVYISGFGG